MNKPDFTLENWQRQRMHEFIFLHCDQTATVILSSVTTDAELVIAALGVDASVGGDGEQTIAYFLNEAGISLSQLDECTKYMLACLQDRSSDQDA